MTAMEDRPSSAGLGDGGGRPGDGTVEGWREAEPRGWNGFASWLWRRLQESAHATQWRRAHALHECQCPGLGAGLW